MKNDGKPDRRRQLTAWLLIVSMTPLATGCDTICDSTITGRLWDAGGVDRCLPAPRPNLKFFRTPGQDDVLVTYDELREKDDAIRRRAFFFKPNVRKLEARKKPKFISPAKWMALRLVPVAEGGTDNAAPGEVVFVKVSEDSQEFTLVWRGAELGPYVLPVYVDRGSRVRRALLTPLTATGDVLVVVVSVGVVGGVIFAYGYAGGQPWRGP